MFKQFVTRANMMSLKLWERFLQNFELSWIPCWTPPRYAEKKIFKAVFGWLSIMSKLPGKCSHRNPEKSSNKNLGNRDISCKLSSLSLIMYGSLALIPQANKQHCPKLPYIAKLETLGKSTGTGS
jgi:hypothetical protein